MMARKRLELLGRHDLKRGRPGARKAPYIELAARFLDDIASGVQQLASYAMRPDAFSHWTAAKRDGMLREVSDALDNLKKTASIVAARIGEERTAEILVNAGKSVQLARILHAHDARQGPPEWLAFDITALAHEAEARATSLNEDLERLRARRIIENGPGPDDRQQFARSAKTRPRLDIKVILKQRRVVVNGTSYDVTSENALRWLVVLLRNRGEFIAGGELHDRDSQLLDVRTDKLKRFLPREIQEAIESKPGAGSRLHV